MTQSTNIDNASSVFGGAFACVGSTGDEGGGGGGDNVRFEEVNFTIPASDISADLTDFPLVIEHGRHIMFPAEIFEATANLINVKIKDGADVMTEVAVFDNSRKKLRIHAKVNLSSSVDNEFTITWDTAPTVTGTVFSAYGLVTSFYGMYQGQDDTDVVNYTGDATTFTARENTAPNPLFVDDVFKTGSQHNVLGYLLTTAVDANELYMVGVGANNTTSAGYLLAVEETGGGQFAELGLDGNAGTNIHTGYFATFSGGNYTASTDGDTLVGEDIVVTGWSDHVGAGKAAYVNGGNKTNQAGWEENDTDHDNGFIGARADESQGLFGHVREVRIASMLPSDAWISYEAKNLLGAALAYDYGTAVIPVAQPNYGTLKVTVPASNIDADLTDFPLVIEHKFGVGGIPTEWFAQASASTISVETEGGTALQTEVAYFDATKSVLRVHVKTDLSSSVDNVFILHANKTPTVTGTVFSAYELVVPIGYAEDIETITDFSPNDYSGSANWNVTTSGVHPVYVGDGKGLGNFGGNIHTDSISIADDLYLIADGEYANIGTYTLAGLSDGTGTMDGVMLRNLSTVGRVASYSDGAGGWLECDNTGNIADRGVGQRFVGSLMYESGVERSIFADGIAKNTDVTVQNPFPTKTRCTIGCRDALTEDLLGKIYEVRAAGFLPSDAWVKAEALNMGGNSFYTIEGNNP